MFDIIEKVDGLILWVLLVIVVVLKFKKFGEIRFCVDMCKVNIVI